jgi:hypothetical protein
MPTNIRSFQGADTRIVRETSYGTTPGSPTFVRLEGFGVVPTATVETDPFAPPGALIPSIVLINDDFSEGSMEGRVDYNGLAYVLAGLFGQPTITSLGGSPAAYQWDWSWNGRRPLRPVSYTLHNGYSDSADVVTGWIFNTLEISGGRADGFDVSGDGFGKAMLAGQALGGIVNEAQTLTITGSPTGGSFTITAFGETTTAIPWNSTAGAVQTIMEALTAFEPGDITVTGGPAPGTPLVFTHGGIYAGENVAQMTANGALLTATGTPTFTTTTPGSDGALTVPAVPAGAVQGNLYLDTTRAGLGTTQVLYAYEMGINIGERMQRVRPINKSKSSDGTIDMGDQEHVITIMFGRNPTGDAQLAKLRASTRSFARCEWSGDVISGANNYLFQTDATVIYTEAGEPNDTDGVNAREYTGRIVTDPVSGVALSFKLVNSIAGLAGV